MDRQNAHIFNVLSEKSASRFEEVNTYSRRMTRWFCGHRRNVESGSEESSSPKLLPEAC
jgi:hypothetical protein